MAAVVGWWRGLRGVVRVWIVLAVTAAVIVGASLLGGGTTDASVRASCNRSSDRWAQPHGATVGGDEWTDHYAACITDKNRGR